MTRRRHPEGDRIRSAERDQGARRRRRRWRPGVAQSDRRRRGDRSAGACGRRRTISTPNLPACRSSTSGSRCWSASGTSARCATRCASRALKLAQSGLEELPQKSSLFVDGASSLLDEAGEDSGISLATLRALLRMVEEKERLVRLLNEYIDGPGLTIVIGQEHRTPDLRAFSLVAATYADGIASRHGRRHRPDAHALFQNHCRRRRRGPGRVAGPPRQHVIRYRAMADQSRRSNPLNPPTSSAWTTKAARRPTTDPAPALADEIVELRKERDGLHDRLLRQAAEFDNYRKRDRSRAQGHGAVWPPSTFSRSCCPIDRRFRARAADRGAGRRVVSSGARDHPPRADGHAAQARGDADRRGRHDLRSAGAPGGLRTRKSPDRRDGEVMEEFRRGYRLGDKLLRPAMVKVAKA